MFNLYASALARNCRAPTQTTSHLQTFPYIYYGSYPPPLKLYNCAKFALNDINEFAKGQGYTVLKNNSRSQDTFADGSPSINGNIS